MTIDSVTAVDPGPVTKIGEDAAGLRSGTAPLFFVSLNNIGAIYVLLIQFVLFTVWIPQTFLTRATVYQVLNNNAIIGLAALSIIIPLAAWVFDLSFAYVMSLSGVTTAYLVANLHWP